LTNKPQTKEGSSFSCRVLSGSLELLKQIGFERHLPVHSQYD